MCGLTFSEKYHNLIYVSSEMHLMTKCGKSGIRVVYNYKIENLLLQWVDKM